ncbi:MAG: hypothetical protein NZ730_01565 [Porticoccaceae bacterium]|nr:hypothetical protein [Porticoccaceae bacterium]
MDNLVAMQMGQKKEQQNIRLRRPPEPPPWVVVWLSFVDLSILGGRATQEACVA